MVDNHYENAARARGYTSVCGIDEAGRGPLCGPVCAAAVILPEHYELPGLNDSKKLTEKKREELWTLITRQAVAYQVSLVDEKTIDEINILNAAMLAMRQAEEGLPVPADYALIDGNKVPGDLQIPAEAIIGGDGKSASIAAASVLAKVTRDHIMRELDEKYPGYGFAKHKGYGTKEHIAAIRELGPCEIHRRSFLTKIL